MSKRHIAGHMEQIEAIPSLELVHAYFEPVLSQHPVSGVEYECERSVPAAGYAARRLSGSVV